jgi:hypothetical protein
MSQKALIIGAEQFDGGSILSFPDRGPWGNYGYRGNCSGHIFRHLFEKLRPQVFTDPMVGSGTSCSATIPFLFYRLIDHQIFCLPSFFSFMSFP